MFLHGMELSDAGENCIVTCFYRDWICVNYCNVATLHVCTGTETVCSTETLHFHMFLNGLKLFEVR